MTIYVDVKHSVNITLLLHGCVSQGLGTTEFTNSID